MKANKQFLLSIATVLLALATVNCGGGGSSGSSTPTAGAYGTTCGTNMLYSQYGCQPACGPQSVMWQGSCQPITQQGYPGTGYPGTGYPGGGNLAVCQGNCPAGLVSVGNGWACLPNSNGCQACYGYLGGYCYQGDGAHAYYGY